MVRKHVRTLKSESVDQAIEIVIPEMPPFASAPDEDFYEYKSYIDNLDNEVGKRNAITMFEIALESREKILEEFGARTFWDEERGKYYTPTNLRPMLSDDPSPLRDKTL